MGDIDTTDRDPQGDTGILRSRGLQFPDDPAFLDQKNRRLLKTSSYEEREANAVRALVGEDDIALELGSGIGFMSTLMARSCKARHVHTFEANPSYIPYIRQVHALNGVSERVTLTNALLGTEAGQTKFYERADFSASSLTPDPQGVASEVVRVHEVDVLDVRQVMSEIRPTALICDIEGAEATLAPHWDLSSVRVAVIELHPQWIGKDGVQAVFDAFASAGLTFFPKFANKKVVTFRRDW